MSTSIGSLNVAVDLDTSKLDAGLKQTERKMKAAGKQLDKEYASMAGKSFGFSEFAGGGGARRGYGRMAGGRDREGGGGLVGGIGGALARRALGGAVGGEGIANSIMGASGRLLGTAAGATAASVTGAAFGSKLIAGWANESKRLDDAALSVQRYGKALDGIIPTFSKIKDFAKDGAISALGQFTQLGELMAGGSREVSVFNQAARGAAEGDARLAAFKALNDPARLGRTRSAIADFQRNQAFDAASPKGQQTILRGEIEALKTKEAKAKTDGRIADSLDAQLTRLQKEAELQKSITEFTAKQKENADAITRAAAERRDAEDAAKRMRFEEFSNQFDADFRDIEKGIYTDRLSRVRGQMSSLRNPFESGGVSGFGSASAAGLQYVQAGNQMLSRILEVMKSVEANTEEALNRA